MSLRRSVSEKVREDAVRVGRQPIVWIDRIRFTVRGVLAGDIPPSRPLKTAAISLGAFAAVLLLLFPIFYVGLSAISGSGGGIYGSGGILPSDPSLKPFLWVIGDLIVPGYRITISIPLTGLEVFLQTPELVILDVSEHGVDDPSNFKTFMWNSITVAIPTVILAMCMVVPGAYALSRREFIMRGKLLYGYVLFTQIGGGLGVAVLIALFAMFVQFGINDNKLALAAYYAATAVPFNTWLLKTYMDSIPVSYEEAAVVDGAPPWRVVAEVILPMSTAGLATVFIFTFLTGWTEFVVAQTLLSTQNYTLPVGLYSLVGEYSIPWARFSAFALTFASPIMIVYLLTQRYIEGGLSFGGMEG